jgi:stage III sporulation protein AH
MQVTKAVTSELAPVVTTDFFTEYRLERDKFRSERSELLRDIIKSSKNDEARQRAQDTVLKLTVNKQKESDMENLIKARGFADALVFVQDSSVSAVVKTSSLTRDEVVQVAEVISRVCGIKPEEITVSAKP